MAFSSFPILSMHMLFEHPSYDCENSEPSVTERASEPPLPHAMSEAQLFVIVLKHGQLVLIVSLNEVDHQR
jgi:hypothetical protein